MTAGVHLGMSADQVAGMIYYYFYGTSKHNKDEFKHFIDLFCQLNNVRISKSKVVNNMTMFGHADLTQRIFEFVLPSIEDALRLVANSTVFYGAKSKDEFINTTVKNLTINLLQHIDVVKQLAILFSKMGLLDLVPQALIDEYKLTPQDPQPLQSASGKQPKTQISQSLIGRNGREVKKTETIPKARNQKEDEPNTAKPTKGNADDNNVGLEDPDEVDEDDEEVSDVESENDGKTHEQIAAEQQAILDEANKIKQEKLKQFQDKFYKPSPQNGSATTTSIGSTDVKRDINPKTTPVIGQANNTGNSIKSKLSLLKISESGNSEELPDDISYLINDLNDTLIREQNSMTTEEKKLNFFRDNKKRQGIFSQVLATLGLLSEKSASVLYGHGLKLKQSIYSALNNVQEGSPDELVTLAENAMELFISLFKLAKVYPEIIISISTGKHGSFVETFGDVSHKFESCVPTTPLDKFSPNYNNGLKNFLFTCSRLYTVCTEIIQSQGLKFSRVDNLACVLSSCLDLESIEMINNNGKEMKISDLIKKSFSDAQQAISLYLFFVHKNNVDSSKITNLWQLRDNQTEEKTKVSSVDQRVKSIEEDFRLLKQGKGPLAKVLLSNTKNTSKPTTSKKIRALNDNDDKPAQKKNGNKSNKRQDSDNQNSKKSQNNKNQKKSEKNDQHDGKKKPSDQNSRKKGNDKKKQD